jgi:ATP-dependent RNA helicase DDX60
MFISISDLCYCIFLEKAVIPQLDVPSTALLNAYLYDYFMHRAVEPLQVVNGIRRGDIWFLLNDFSLVLATIVISLAGFLRVKPMEDGEMVNIAGLGDAMEEDVDRVEESGGLSDMSSKLVGAKSPESSQKAHQKEVVPDSWDGSDWGGQEDIIAGEEETFTGSTFDSWMDADDSSSSGGSSSEGGLMNVRVGAITRGPPSLNKRN